jgi:3'-5' exoribonuclease
VLDIASLAPGDRVQHELMVRSREDRTTKDGDPYAVIGFGNATGRISATVFTEQLPWFEGLRPGAVVQVIGAVETYQGRRQLRLTAPPRVLAPEAVNLDEFLPRITFDRASLWSRVDEWRTAIRSGRLRRAVDLFFADDVFRAAFENSPAAPVGHHARVGGLLLHVVEVGNIARTAARTMRGDVDLVTTGALLHDIGKVEAYQASAAGFGYTPAGRLIGHVALGVLMLERRLRALPSGTLTEEQETELQHFILSHHGDPAFGAAVKPMTLEAELLYWADQTSARGNDFTEAYSDPDLFPGDEAFSVRQSWRLERTVWRRPTKWD